MNVKKIIASTVVAATLLAGGGALLGGTAANAAQPPAATSTKHVPKGHRGRRRAVRRQAITISAKTIGIPRQELVAQLKDGKSVADVATAHGVNPEKVVSALVDAGDKAIDKAVANHRLTPERAATLKAKLPAAAEKAVHAHRK